MSGLFLDDEDHKEVMEVDQGEVVMEVDETPPRRPTQTAQRILAAIARAEDLCRKGEQDKRSRSRSCDREDLKCHQKLFDYNIKRLGFDLLF